MNSFENLSSSHYVTLPFQSRSAAKVEQQFHPHSGCLQVIQQLSLLSAGESVEHLQFSNDLTKQNQIRSIFLLQGLSLVPNEQALLTLERNPSSA